MRIVLTLLVVAVGVFADAAWPADARAQALHGPGGHIPDFAAAPTIVSVGNGLWSNPATWSPSRVPLATDIVRITYDVSFDTLTGTADVIGIEAGGQLRFVTNQSTHLHVGILLVKPGGVLEVGTPAQPVPPEMTAEIVIADRALNDTTDPDQWGTGLLAAGGQVRMQGAIKTPTFVRTAVEPLAGQMVIQLEQAITGWRVGDEVFLPDTRHVGESDKFNSNYALNDERRTIQSIATDGRSVTLSAQLDYDHRGARDANGTPTVLQNGIKLLPHVGNLTRNVVIRSANPLGTRGHTVYTHRADVAIAYVEFRDLGRTKADTIHQTCSDAGEGETCNHVGRYPLHIHHLWGVANPTPDEGDYQFQLVGNAVRDSLKWPIAVHASHYGLIKENVVYGGDQFTGAGIAVEDGSETQNRFESNFVAVIRGEVNPRESGSNTLTPGSGAECYWGAGFNNRFVNNVASTCRNAFQQVVSGVGFKFFSPPQADTTEIPLFPGADLDIPAERTIVTPQLQPLLEFRDNEVYGGTASGFTIWHLGADGYNLPDPLTSASSTVKDFRVWNVYESAVWLYPTNRLIVDGLIQRIDPSADIVYWEPSVQSNDYQLVDLTIRGGDIHAGSVFGNATAPMRTIRIENVHATTHETAFNFGTPRTPGTFAQIPDPPGVTAFLSNNIIAAWPSLPLSTVGTYFTNDAPSFPFVTYRIFVDDHQGQSGNDFRVYWLEQETQVVHGGLAPCADTTTHPDVDAITCVNSAPTLVLGAQTTPEGTVVSLAVTASDPDGVASYSAVGLPPGLTINATSGSITGTLSFSSSGVYPVTLTITDIGGAALTHNFTWTVTGLTDNPLMPRVTPVRAVHITELRTRIDAVRVRYGLTGYAWTNATPVAGVTTIRAVHIAELRTRLAEAYVAAGRTPPTYTDPSLGAGVTMKAAHISEIRAALVAIE